MASVPRREIPASRVAGPEIAQKEYNSECRACGLHAEQSTTAKIRRHHIPVHRFRSQSGCLSSNRRTRAACPTTNCPAKRTPECAWTMQRTRQLREPTSEAVTSSSRNDARSERGPMLPSLPHKNGNAGQVLRKWPRVCSTLCAAITAQHPAPPGSPRPTPPPPKSFHDPSTSFAMRLFDRRAHTLPNLSRSLDRLECSGDRSRRHDRDHP